MAAKAQDPVQKNPSTLRTKQIIISSDSVFLDSPVFLGFLNSLK
jgi:hypothetical protein